MNSELSFATLLIWAVIIQVAMLALLGLILMFRRFRQASRSTIRDGPSSVTHLRYRWLLSGGLIGAILVAAGIYHFILPKEQPWYEPYHPGTRPGVHTRSNIASKDTEQVPTESPPHRSHRDLRTRKEGSGSRIREVTRRFLRGRPPAERKGFKTPDPVLHAYLSLINKWQMESRTQPKGRGLAADTVYDRLVKKHGFKGSRSAIRNYLAHPPYSIPEGCGRAAEVDWIPVSVVINREAASLECFFMTSKWSGRFFIFCYRCDHLASFLDAHMRALDFFGGIFPSLVYRALSGPMAETLRSENTPQKEKFDRFCTYYNFSPELLSKDKGPDLNSRERRLRDLFSNRLLSTPPFHNLDQLNRTLLESARATVQGTDIGNGHAEAIHDLYEREKICLLAFPETRFANVTHVKTMIGPSGTLQLGDDRYHVPQAYAGMTVQVVLSYNRVDILVGSDHIASFARTCGANRFISTN
ncbi:MAG: hypothetical protein JRL30_00670 [Deltaproteobacteria bacterium]|nr:hypothetical protein [Deltaproteobacteria bacterium]